MTVEKIMALGALPPAFPAINIEGRFYWDGGILSNTPTEVVFDDIPLHNSRNLCGANPKGPVPRKPGGSASAKGHSIFERVASHAARQQQAHRLRHVISQLVQQIPAEQRTSEIVRELARYGCMTQMHVLRLVAPRIENERHTKDIDFSALGISGCCEAGYAATWNALERAPWRGKFDPIEGVIIHEEVAELPSAAEVPQRAASWSIAGEAHNARDLRLDAAISWPRMVDFLLSVQKG